MKLQEKVGQRLMVGIKKSILDQETKDILGEIQPGAVILFGRNIVSASQVTELISEVKALLLHPPLIAIDQEGGLVVRFTKEITVFPGNMALGAVGLGDLAYQQGLVSAWELKNIGIDINLAPVMDVVTTYHNPGITIRSFGSDAYKVAELGVSYIQGTQKMNVAAVAKHFPGKGAAEVDAHIDLPVVSVPPKTFEETHVLPFKKAIENGVKGIMSTHIHCPFLDKKEKRPATFSPEIVGNFLRKKLNFDGVIFSDDLEMGAIARYYTIEEACAHATLSGHDFLLICSDYKKQRDGFNSLVDAYQRARLPLKEMEESVARIQSLKSFCRSKLPVAPSPASPENFSALAQEIGGKSITFAGPEKGFTPLRGSCKERMVLIMPDLSSLNSIEEGYSPSEEHFFIKEFKRHFSGTLLTRFMPIKVSSQEIEETLNLISEKDTVIGCIFDAQSYSGQRDLLKRLQGLKNELILALLRNPFDIEFVESDMTCLITYGFRKIQLLSLLEVLFGKIGAKGCLPFERL